MTDTMTIDERRKAIREAVATHIWHEEMDADQVFGVGRRNRLWIQKKDLYLARAEAMSKVYSDNGAVLNLDPRVSGVVTTAPLVDPESLASLDTGMAQSVSGHTVNLGSFAQYVEPEKPPGPHRGLVDGPSGVELPATRDGGRVVDYSAGQRISSDG